MFTANHDEDFSGRVDTLYKFAQLLVVHIFIQLTRTDVCRLETVPECASLVFIQGLEKAVDLLEKGSVLLPGEPHMPQNLVVCHCSPLSLNA
jgi:hypothetical protein